MDSAMMYDDQLYHLQHHQPPHHRRFHPGTVACGGTNVVGGGVAGPLRQPIAAVQGPPMQPLLDFSPLIIEPDAKWRRISDEDDIIDDLPSLATTPDIESFLFQTSLPTLGTPSLPIATPLDAVEDDDNVLSLLADEAGCAHGGVSMVTSSSSTPIPSKPAAASSTVAASSETDILFPGLVTAEQEAYARGFVDALEELRRHDGASNFTIHHRPKPASVNESIISVSNSPGSTTNTSAVGQRTSSVLPVALVRGQAAKMSGESMPLASVNKGTVGYTNGPHGRPQDDVSGTSSVAAVATDALLPVRRPDVVAPANAWIYDDCDRVFWRSNNDVSGLGQQSSLVAPPTFNAVLPPPLRHQVGGTVYQQSNPPSTVAPVTKFETSPKASTLLIQPSICDVLSRKTGYQFDLLTPNLKSPPGDARVARSPVSGVDTELAQTVPRLGFTPPLSVTSSTSTDDRLSVTVTSSGGLETTDDDDIEPSASELARADRKRERNRLAARKCRSRKLEQIATLEARCAVLRAENEALARSACGLAGDVSRLRDQLSRHVALTECCIGAVSHPSWPSSTGKLTGTSAAAATVASATESHSGHDVNMPETSSCFQTVSVNS